MFKFCAQKLNFQPGKKANISNSNFLASPRFSALTVLSHKQILHHQMSVIWFLSHEPHCRQTPADHLLPHNEHQQILLDMV